MLNGVMTSELSALAMVFAMRTNFFVLTMVSLVDAALACSCLTCAATASHASFLALPFNLVLLLRSQVREPEECNHKHEL